MLIKPVETSVLGAVLLTSRDGMLGSVGRMMFGRVPLKLDTTPRLAARAFRLGMVSSLIEGTAVSTAVSRVVMMVGSDVRLASSCFMLLN